MYNRSFDKTTMGRQGPTGEKRSQESKAEFLPEPKKEIY